MNSRGTRKQAKEKRVYEYEFPKPGVSWPMKKSGKVVAASRTEARRKLVARGLLEPFESKVTWFRLIERPA